MFRLLSIILIFVYASSGFAQKLEDLRCEVELASHIFLTYSQKNNIPDHELFISDSNCQNSQLNYLRDFLMDARGSINLNRISDYNSELSNLIFNRDQVRVYRLEDIIKEKLNLSADRFVTNANIIGNQHILTFDENIHISANCNTCQRNGLQSVELIFRTNEGGIQSHWVQSQIKSRAIALVASSQVSVTHNSIDRGQFELKEVYSETPENLFYEADLDRIHFYRLNRSLSRGEALSRSHTSPMRLVRQGSPVNISLNKSGISLSGKATAMTSGHIGESVRLRHPQNNRIITGKVVDYNRVVIDL